MSDKPLAERLQLKRGRTLAVVNAPAELQLSPDASPEAADIVLAFARDRAQLDSLLASLLDRIGPQAILWLAYPKLSARLAGDLSRDVIRAAAPSYGLDTVSQIAIDLDWSALRLKRA